MMDGRAGHGHGHGLARGGIFVEFLDGVSRPSSRSIADTHWPGFGRGGPVSKSAGGTADAAMRETSTAADVHNHAKTQSGRTTGSSGDPRGWTTCVTPPPEGSRIMSGHRRDRATCQPAGRTDFAQPERHAVPLPCTNAR